MSSVQAAGMGDLAIWFGAVLGAVVVLAIALLVLRRKFRPGGGVRDEESAGFGMEQLESMLESGQISLEEFRVLRRLALGLDAGAACGDNAPSSAGGNDDDDSSAAGS